MKRLKVQYLRGSVSYKQGMRLMRSIFNKICANASDSQSKLILLEHKNTITATRKNKTKSLKTSIYEISKENIDFILSDRGGDLTFHGNGQLVGYLITYLRIGAVDYLRKLEIALLNSCRKLEVGNCFLKKNMSGIWIKSKGTVPKKIASVGVGFSNGVTKHGFSFNASANLDLFERHIVPCGLNGLKTVNLKSELKSKMKPSFFLEVCDIIIEEICNEFNFKYELLR